MRNSKLKAVVSLIGCVVLSAAAWGQPGSAESVIASAPLGPSCDVRIPFEYLQWDKAVRIEGSISNEDCAASGGDYEFEVSIRDENGELQILKFAESWQRIDDQPVLFGAEYPIGDNVDLINVRTRNASCSCADSAGETTVAAGAQIENATRSARRLRETEAGAAAELECRPMRVTGSRVPRRVCGTPEEWATLDGEGEDGAEDFLRRNEERSTISTPAPQPFPF